MSGPQTSAGVEAAHEAAIRKAIASTARPPRPGVASLLLTFGWRGMLKVWHVPEQLLDATITPVLFLLMFTYLFGGTIQGSTGEYLQYVLPGILAQSVLLTTVYSGVAINMDMTKGVVDRFRSLPIWRPAPLVGSVLGDSVRYLVAAAIVVLLGLAMGYDIEGGVAGALGAILLVVIFAFGLAWIFTSVGVVMRAPNAVMNAGFMVIFPLLFLSNTFVEPDTLPGWLKAFVDVNPISRVVTAARGLLEGNPDAAEIGLVVGMAAFLTVVFGPLTARLYRRA